MQSHDFWAEVVAKTIQQMALANSLEAPVAHAMTSQGEEDALEPPHSARLAGWPGQDQDRV